MFFRGRESTRNLNTLDKKNTFKKVLLFVTTFLILSQQKHDILPSR